MRSALASGGVPAGQSLPFSTGCGSKLPWSQRMAFFSKQTIFSRSRIENLKR
jgi:hypothetical protein